MAMNTPIGKKLKSLSPSTMNKSALDAYAAEQGLKPVVGGYGKGFASLPTSQINMLANQAAGKPGSLLDQLSGAFATDAESVQAAEDERFAGASTALGDLGTTLGGISGKAAGINSNLESIISGAPKNFKTGDADALNAGINEAKGFLKGSSADADAAAAATVGDVDAKVGSAVGRANQQADASIASAQRAADEFGANTNNAIQALVQGAQANIKSQMMQVNAGRNPDGSPMTPEQQAASRKQLAGSAAQATAQVTAQVQQNADVHLSQLRSNVASLQAKAADTALAGGQLGLAGEQIKSQARNFAVSTKAEAGKGIGALESTKFQLTSAEAMAINQMHTTLAQTFAGLASTVEMQALELEVQGKTELAKLMMNHVKSPVSMFSGIAQLAAAKKAGAGNVAGVKIA